nr:hypothetical protein [Tanacetum cinerariifolium]
MGLKIEIPEFTGNVRPDAFIDWLSTVERVFDVRDIPNKMKVKISWPSSFDNMLRYSGIMLIKGSELKGNQSLGLKIEILEFTCKNMTMEEVINEFDKLRMSCDVVKEEEQVVERYLGVLKPEIADICGGLGHYARDCPNLKTLAFVPDDAGPIYDTDAKPKLDESGDELVYLDRGEALVILRVLNAAAADPKTRAPSITARLPDRDNRYRDDPIHIMRLKIQIPEFIGKAHLDDFISWLSMVEQRQRIEGKSKVETWERMKKLMKAKFLPENHRQEAFLDYHNLS